VVWVHGNVRQLKADRHDAPHRADRVGLCTQSRRSGGPAVGPVRWCGPAPPRVSLERLGRPGCATRLGLAALPLTPAGPSVVGVLGLRGQALRAPSKGSSEGSLKACRGRRNCWAEPPLGSDRNMAVIAVTQDCSLNGVTASFSPARGRPKARTTNWFDSYVRRHQRWSPGDAGQGRQECPDWRRRQLGAYGSSENESPVTVRITRK
jgi:hypothetical protein